VNLLDMSLYIGNLTLFHINIIWLLSFVGATVVLFFYRFYGD